ncbi:MAG: hypothetical protein E7675_07540 [Ruminococcaceae bacterium]|nr:hypothetical protein [Oscillospiraceae bacterium]
MEYCNDLFYFMYSPIIEKTVKRIKSNSAYPVAKKIHMPRLPISSFDKSSNLLLYVFTRITMEMTIKLKSQKTNISVGSCILKIF